MWQNTCFFTGHRRLPKDRISRIQLLLHEHITALYEEGFIHFISGGALGFDLLAAETVLLAKETREDLMLEMALPAAHYSKYWPDAEKKRLCDVMEGADCVTTLSPVYTADCMHLRNRYMVDRSACGIAYLTGSSGGTYYTVCYAAAQDRRIINLAERL